MSEEAIAVVVSSCLVKIPTNHRQHPIEPPPPSSRLDLTPWDLQLFLLGPIQKGLLFPDTHPHASLVDHLRRSLSETLAFFPPLAGRLAKRGGEAVSYHVDCNNAGVEFVHAAAKNSSVSDILEPNYIPRETVASFFPLSDNSYRNCDGDVRPLLGVQVTELKDGVFIACTANHAVVDGNSFWHFFNSWAEISRGLDRPRILPVFDRWFPGNIPAEDRIYQLPKFGWCEAAIEEGQPAASPPAPPLLEKAFHFSKECLAKLKAKANAEAGTSTAISAFQSLAAHLWRSVERCRRINGSEIKDEEVQIMILVSARPRIPLPNGYFGNTIIGAKTSITYRELSHNGLGHTASKVNELVSRQTRESSVKFVEEWAGNPMVHDKLSLIKFAMSSSPRHDVYGCDFGWGKPLAVRSGKAQKFDGKMTLFPSAAEGGIDVEACLEEETLKVLEKDGEFLQALCV